MVEECLLDAGIVEPIILTVSEFSEKLHRKDPAVIAAERGITLLNDLELGKPKTSS